MYRKLTLVFTLLFAVGILMAGEAIAQDMAKVKADYDKLAAEIAQLTQQLKDASANQDVEGFNKLNPQREAKKAELLKLQEILKGDQATRQALNEIKRIYKDGISAYGVGRYSEAIRKFDDGISKAIALNNPLSKGDIVNCYIGKSTVFLKQKKYPETQQSATKAADLDPNSWKAYYFMAKAYERMADYPNAERTYLRSIELEPGATNFTSRISLGSMQLSKTKEYRKASESLYGAVQVKPDYARGFTYLGRSYFEQNQFENAIGAFQQAISLKVNDWEPHYYLSSSYNKNLRYQDAIASATNCLKYKRGHGGSLIERGFAYEKLGQNQKALFEYQEAKKDRRYRDLADWHIKILTDK